MDINSVTGQATNAAIVNESRQSLSSDLDTFLKLLTAQIRNQDPLEPADGTEYAAQLATFSNVEQGVRTNELLTDMVSKLTQQDVATAANWIGMDLRHDGPLALEQDPVRVFTDIPVVADRAELVISDADGNELVRRPIAPGTDKLDWAGADGAGGTLPPGIYQLSVASYAGAQDLGIRPVTHFARVQEVALGPNGTEITLAGGVRIGIGDMEGLRAPEN